MQMLTSDRFLEYQKHLWSRSTVTGNVLQLLSTCLKISRNTVVLGSYHLTLEHKAMDKRQLQKFPSLISHSLCLFGCLTSVCKQESSILILFRLLPEMEPMGWEMVDMRLSPVLETYKGKAWIGPSAEGRQL